MPHIAEGLLHAHLDGALGPDEQIQWTAAERHLEVCEDCRERLEEARAVRSSARELLSGASATARPGPGFEVLAAEAAMRRAGKGGGSAPWWRSAVRLAWAASLVMAAGAGWLGHELLMERGGAPPSVAEAPEESPAAAAAEKPAAATPEGRRAEGAADVVGDAARDRAARSEAEADEAEAGAAGAPAADELEGLAPQALADGASEPRCYAADDGGELEDLDPNADLDRALRGLRLEVDGTVRGRTAAGPLVGFWERAAADTVVLRVTNGAGWRELRVQEDADGLRGSSEGTSIDFRRTDCARY
ncbi:MAG: anti-sigma factor family protein [Gemmatimonadota bacterium]